MLTTLMGTEHDPLQLQHPSSQDVSVAGLPDTAGITTIHEVCVCLHVCTCVSTH